MNTSDDLILLPGNWLFNASVVGFVYSLETVEGFEIGPADESVSAPTSGELRLSRNVFGKVRTNDRYFSQHKVSSIVGNAALFRNYINPSRKQDKDGFPAFVSELANVDEGNQGCFLCGSKRSLVDASVDRLNRMWSELGGKPNDFAAFLEGVTMFGNRHTNLLGPAITEFPNGYWNLSQTSYTCPLCAFLLVHHHLAFSRLHDGTEVFVNAPSFRLMLDLNRIVGGQLAVSSGEGASSKREILAMSVIEYSSKVNATLGIWMGMNLEVVIRRRERVGTSGNPKKDFDDVIEFFSLPYETTMILADRGIATTLKQIGDFRVLNLVLNRQYKKIVEDAHRLMKISLKNELSDFDWNYLNGHFIFRLKKRLDDREKEFLLRKARVTAQNMLRLYALIEPKTNVGGTS